MVVKSLKIYGFTLALLSSFSLVWSMEEEGKKETYVELEAINFLPRPAAKIRVVSASPRVSRKKQDSSQDLNASHTDVKSKSVSPNLLCKVLEKKIDATAREKKYTKINTIKEEEAKQKSDRYAEKKAKLEQILEAKEKKLRAILPGVLPVRSRKYNQDVAKRQANILRPAKKSNK